MATRRHRTRRQGLKNKKTRRGGNKANAWIQYLKAYMADHPNIPPRKAMVEAAMQYRKQKK